MIRIGVLLAFLVAACGPIGAPAEPTPVPALNRAEDDLVFGIRRDVGASCAAVREGLPAGATAAVTCTTSTTIAQSLSLVRFDNDRQLLDAYFGGLANRGVAPRSGGCVDGTSGEDAYWPGDEPEAPIPARQACIVEGSVTIVLVTMVPAVLAEIHASDVNPQAVQEWLWWGNQDVPGGPTIWNEDGPIEVEKG